MDLELLGQFSKTLEFFSYLCVGAFILIFGLFIRKGTKYKPSIVTVISMFFIVLFSLVTLTLMQNKQNNMIRLEYIQFLSEGADLYSVKINGMPVNSLKVVPLLLAVEDINGQQQAANKKIGLTVEVTNVNNKKVVLMIFKSQARKDEWLIFSKIPWNDYTNRRFIGPVNDEYGIINSII
ncbi:hypothetical protein CW745_16320 [Psychromonas sp. psych-6C06]|uniref:hypothetical protein n=1 Tax=Psychromonas sp. psych-6C06 TaxID=2058089 RepID=UPI000C32BF6E|nr:hypothetical protein [Psychromonas sp. psych-6C06]PKF60193.1 hypothetical protein CW745_16320 [Psychromonas sp. psych-6C06]